MKAKTLLRLVIIACVALIISQTAWAASPKDVPKMTVENLKKLLDDPESGLIIIDVRTGSSWTNSEYLIKSALREDPKNFDSWATKHPKEKTFVLYCS